MSDETIVSSSTVQKSISTETGVEAAKVVAEVAQKNAVEIALVGGIAMHIYGFTRATTDVDMLAASVLPLESREKLTFGGESYDVTVDERIVSVDVIVRNDKLAKIYQAALTDARMTDFGVRIASPEWLVVMKHFSARAKDALDLIWLLQEKDLVDREMLGERLSFAIGEDAAFYVLSDLQNEYDYADFLKVREKSKYSK